VPRAEDPWRRGRWLASDRRRESPQHVCRPRAREDAEAQGGGRGARGHALGGADDLHAPDVGALRCREVVVRGLVIVDEHAVAATGENPRYREVRRVVARAKSGLRQDTPDQPSVLLDPGAIGDVALNTSPAMLRDIRALAETIEAFVRRRPPGGADAQDLGRASPVGSFDLDDA